jgi:hypothetical protein
MVVSLRELPPKMTIVGSSVRVCIRALTLVALDVLMLACAGAPACAPCLFAAVAHQMFVGPSWTPWAEPRSVYRPCLWITPYEPSLARALVAHERAVRRGPDPV